MSQIETNNLDNALDTFIEGAGEISSALLGMVNKVGGQIYALLFLSEKPLSLDEISERLQISKSNISINIRMLEKYSLVKKVWVKGSRKDYYEAARVYPKKVITGFLERIQGTIQNAVSTIEKTKTAVKETEDSLNNDEKDKAKFMLEQLNLVGSFYYAAMYFFEDFFAGKPLNVDVLRHMISNPEDLKNPIEK